ncbi:uncharacterized protein LOC115229781 [Octopus sinensis]|uniref:Uncharacterized protein LOC115229781 n=1 Tax=Octopus sinensis TaxID=2607531 RepID=A0A6P7TVV9_9MOLL|nr:uncharacterized protein LOC115229781 [Octopus sinensis]
MSGRKRDSLWAYFDKRIIPGKTGSRARCRNCGKDIQGLVSRMRQHHLLCRSNIDIPENMPRPESEFPPRMKDHSLINFVTTTTSSKKDLMDLQLARYIFSTNTPFAAVEHPEFVKFVQMLLPGYRLPSRHQIGGTLLDHVYDQIHEDCRQRLQDKTVSMMLDGWSNIHNEPVICVSVVTSDGENYLIDTVDTSGYSHTAEYLQSVALASAQLAEQRFGCKIGSLVTDNAANMTKMRRIMMEDGNEIITYGCSAHYLNLLVKDVEVADVKGTIVTINKYFRNVHLPAAWYKSNGGKKLVLPIDVRWNTLSDCFQSYLDNWSIILRTCEEHRTDIDTEIFPKVQNISLKRRVEEYLMLIKPIAVALDKIQNDSTTISHAVEIWKELEQTYIDNGCTNILGKVRIRAKQALTPFHLLANLIDPTCSGKSSSNVEAGDRKSSQTCFHLQAFK